MPATAQGRAAERASSPIGDLDRLPAAHRAALLQLFLVLHLLRRSRCWGPDVVPRPRTIDTNPPRGPRHANETIAAAKPSRPLRSALEFK
jgi:hypothetical protein